MTSSSERFALEHAIHVLSPARKVVVTTGAGMSKESGIATFRDAPNALWANYNPEELASPVGFRNNPTRVWKWYRDRRRMIAAARPHAGHFAIARMEELYDEFLLITQNIDNLHHAAGSRNLVELHGNIFRYRCFERNHPAPDVTGDSDVPPRCACGALIRPDVVWFGEMIDETDLDRSFSAIAECDAVLVVGTSALVHPAAGFPAMARGHGASVVEINPDRTPITPIADVFVSGRAGELLPPLIDGIRAERA